MKVWEWGEHSHGTFGSPSKWLLHHHENVVQFETRWQPTYHHLCRKETGPEDATLRKSESSVHWETQTKWLNRALWKLCIRKIPLWTDTHIVTAKQDAYFKVFLLLLTRSPWKFHPSSSIYSLTSYRTHIWKNKSSSVHFISTPLHCPLNTCTWKFVLTAVMGDRREWQKL